MVNYDKNSSFASRVAFNVWIGEMHGRKRRRIFLYNLDMMVKFTLTGEVSITR